jgi:hypothetical protein
MLPNVNEVMEENPNMERDGVPLLEWLDDNSEAESFTVVQSRKKEKRQIKTPMENPLGMTLLRGAKEQHPPYMEMLAIRKILILQGRKQQQEFLNHERAILDFHMD